MDAAFRTEMADGYRLDEPAIALGSPMLGDEVLTEVRVQLALARVNRHGLIAGATGTGKTKTLQTLGRTSTATVPTSIKRTRNALIWSALPLLGRALEQLHTQGVERFVERTARENASPIFYSNPSVNPGKRERTGRARSPSAPEPTCAHSAWVAESGRHRPPAG